MKTLDIREHCILLHNPIHDNVFLLKERLDRQLQQLDLQAVS